MKAENISGHRLKVEYGFRKTRIRTLIEPNQIIDIDDFDYGYLERLGVFRNQEMRILPEEIDSTDRMTKAKQDVEAYIKKK